MEIPRPEHPRPERFRESWLNLNGRWECEFDPGRSGVERKMYEDGRFTKEIVVPYCLESELSGLGYKDFVPGLWYRRTFEVPSSWRNGRVLLHVGASDFFTRVYVNGRKAGEHRGGYTPFAFDVTAMLKHRANVVVIGVEDDLRSREQPRGKQCASYFSRGCDYTRVTGIWQTVWLEAVPRTYIAQFKVRPDLDNAVVTVEVVPGGEVAEGTLDATVLAEGKAVATAHTKLAGGPVTVQTTLPEVVAWRPGQPFLYDLELKLSTGAGVDEVKGYFGMRQVHTAGRTILLNNEPLYLRTVLDQGYYPDGIYTAPSDVALKQDIELSQAAGFNGARLHQKVFEPRFLYWADRMGYLVFGETGDWRVDLVHPRTVANVVVGWLEELERDFNHPSIIGWCPFNETIYTHGEMAAKMQQYLYRLNKTLDPGRLAIDSSGYVHYEGTGSDLYDVHSYQMPDELRTVMAPLVDGRWGEAFRNYPQHDAPYDGTKPYFASEIGGIWWNPRSQGGDWGYGNRPRTEVEFVERYVGTIRALLAVPNLCGWCYTQLYDIEQETNGIYYYDRTAKFSSGGMAAIREANQGRTRYPGP